MEYDFTKRERDFGRIVFALTLDRKKMRERVIVGRNTEVSLRFVSAKFIMTKRARSVLC
jgi:hypothetical protein